MRPSFLLVLGAVLFLSVPADAVHPSFLSTLHSLSTVASTVPGNGDVNPYGVAVVPTTAGTLVAKSVLVSNFNNVANLQGTGTTIVQISPSGSFSPFAQN
jgi:hypothetical protein